VNRTFLEITSPWDLDEIKRDLVRHTSDVLTPPLGQAAMFCAAAGELWPPESCLGVRVGQGYSAALAARDISGASHLVELRHIVILGPAAQDAALIMMALFEEDLVTMENSAGKLRDARNRPAPARPLTVDWV
jgi:hypothetical protein